MGEFTSDTLSVRALEIIFSKTVSSASCNHNLIQRTIHDREFRRHPILVFRGRLAVEASLHKGTPSETPRVGRTGRRLDVDDGVGAGQ
jgi:hypothetical protein